MHSIVNMMARPIQPVNRVATGTRQSLLALMTILAQSLLTLVSSHLVALLLFSVRHNFLIFYVIYNFKP